MRSPAKGTYLIGLGMVVALAGQPARAGERPLLVVVEASPDLGADAAEIRRAIGGELQTETIAPLKTPADPPERVLIVALDRERITVSWRTNDAAPVVRTIPAPSEHAARLRAIAWLAGNLARDQVSPLLVTLPDAPPPAPTASAATSAAASSPASQSIEPPPFESTETTLTTHFNPAATHRSPWTIGAAAGLAVNTYDLAHSLRQSIFGSWPASEVGDVFSRASTTWRVDLRHRTDGSRLFTGLVLEGASAFDTSGFGTGAILGAAGLVGSTLQLGRWSLEASVGGGIDLDQQITQVVVTMNSSTNGFTSSVTQQTGIRPALYAAGTVALAHPIFEPVDAVLSLNAHISVTDEYDGYLAATLGLRYNL